MNLLLQVEKAEIFMFENHNGSGEKKTRELKLSFSRVELTCKANVPGT